MVGLKKLSKHSLFVLLLALACLTIVHCKSDDNDTTTITQEDCSDGVDNDGDGLIDCDDLNCLNASACQEICDDGIDNDNDGFIDCDDGDCEDFDDCQFERCIDGVDNDGDGLIDCEDPDCDTNPNCT